jgi:hypothetical protein
MKQLFAFVVRRRAPRPPTPTASDDPAPAVAQEGGGGPSEKRRRRASAAWKPTLVAISEDAAVTSGVATVAKPPAAKAKARPPSPRAARSSYHDFR